jgi:predicted dehydrogenase
MIWLIGAGGMSVDYAKVLKSQNERFIVVGRGESSAKSFQAKTEEPVVVGGLLSFLETGPKIPDAAIVSVGVEQLYNTSMKLLNYGIKRLLVEKPGGLTFDEILKLKIEAARVNAQIFIAYNRRFYSSVIKAQELIARDGGVTSFNFELTEWSHVIETLDKQPSVLAHWFLANSTHVADLAFFLGGKPGKISCFSAGSLEWHPTSAVFAGSGISENGALFNYGADWESAGRWSVEVMTKKNRYILRPMEALLIQNRGTVNQELVGINNVLDKDFKPGLYLQVKAFLDSDTHYLCSLEEQLALFPVYEQMAGYKKEVFK